MRIGTRLLVVAALLLGLVMMHHVAQPGRPETPGAGHSAGHAAAATTADSHAARGGASGGAAHGADPDHSGTSHGLLHLCLAVLTAAVLLILGGLLVRRRWLPALSACVARSVRPVPRPPPPRLYGAALLTSLCVLRT